jgi:hypothetical protein
MHINGVRADRKQLAAFFFEILVKRGGLLEFSRTDEGEVRRIKNNGNPFPLKVGKFKTLDIVNLINLDVEIWNGFTDLEHVHSPYW